MSCLSENNKDSLSEAVDSGPTQNKQMKACAQ